MSRILQTEISSRSLSCVEEELFSFVVLKLNISQLHKVNDLEVLFKNVECLLERIS